MLVLSLICSGYWKLHVGKNGAFNPLYLVLLASITLAIIFGTDFLYRYFKVKARQESGENNIR